MAAYPSYKFGNSGIKAQRTKKQYALVSPYTGEEYSANPHDYWSASNQTVFKDYEGNNMQLAEMGYDQIGNYHIKRIVKKRVTVGDLRNLEER